MEIDIPEPVAAAVLEANEAISLIYPEYPYIPTFFPRKISCTRELVCRDACGKMMLLIFAIHMETPETVIYAKSVLWYDRNVSAWVCGVKELTIKYREYKWLYRPGWLRPVLLRSAPRRWKRSDISTLPTRSKRLSYGKSSNGWTSAEIRLQLHKPEERTYRGLCPIIKDRRKRT